MDESKRHEPVFSARVIAQLVVFIVAVPLLPLLISWRWGWWEAWVYAAVSTLGFVISRALVARRHPDLLAERARFMQHENAKPWDRVLAPLLGIGGALVPFVAGLDERFGWSPPLALAVKIGALLFLLAGYWLASYALLENRFFSGMVRIQTERGHHVVSSGPYRWIRHPGYAGSVIIYLATPLFLDSVWAFVPAALLIVVLVIRTRLEDRALHEELDGYREYAARVRHRFIPGVW